MSEFENSEMSPKKILTHSEILQQCAQWWEKEIARTLDEIDETSDYERKEFLHDRMTYLAFKGQFESKEMKKIEDTIDKDKQKKVIKGSISFIRDRKN